MKRNFHFYCENFKTWKKERNEDPKRYKFRVHVWEELICESAHSYLSNLESFIVVSIDLV